MEAAKSNGRIIQLDGVRGIAVLMVVAYHFVALQYDKMDKTTLNIVERTLIKLTSIGWCGVDLFFVLSGFLIGTILLKNIRSKSFFKTFYIRRFCRIIPIYYVLLIAFMILKMTPLYDPNTSLFEKDIPIWYYFLFLQNFAMGFYHTFGPVGIGATWSLAVEEQFYLIIPLLIHYFKPKYYIYIILAGLLLAPVCRMLTDNYYVGYTWLTCRINSPMIGFLIAVLMEKDSFKTWVRKNFTALKIATVIFLALSALIHVYLTAGAFNHSLIGIAFGLVVIVALFTETGWLYRLLSSKILLFFGGISYFLYLFHQLINDVLHLAILHQTWPKLDSQAAIWLTVFGFGFTVLLGKLSYKYFEGPLIKYGHQFKY